MAEERDFVLEGPTDEREWLEADRLGGFSMGTATGIRNRRYHALLTTATSPPTGRVVLVAGVEAWLEAPGGRVFLTTQRYAPDVLYPDGVRRLSHFSHKPWPTWTYALEDGGEVVHELFCEPESAQVVLSWRFRSTDAARRVLCVRPLLAVRDLHSLCHQNESFAFDASVIGGNVAWHPYPERPGVTVLSTGRYEHAPFWYQRFLHATEKSRGFDFLEDLASPGIFHCDLRAGRTQGEAVLILRAGHSPYGDARRTAQNLRSQERERRASFKNALELAADAYLVRRGLGLTVMAGFPWFADWGRDTFIALRGLCLATERLDDAKQVLLTWSETVSEGMLPNAFADGEHEPVYNSVDASLWFVVLVAECLDACEQSGVEVPEDERAQLFSTIEAILRAYENGTRYSIHAADDGLLAAGEAGAQLTWMDAKIGDRVVTPRTGKPVEIQALWVNALAVGERVDSAFAALRESAHSAFLKRFIKEDGTLFDVVDADHIEGNDDSSFRPNQVFAVGGLPVALLAGRAARVVVDALEQRLWTPLGLRTLDADHPSYCPRYEGGVVERDEAYHQGTAWPWLAGPFVEAWLRTRTRAESVSASAEAQRRFVEPLLESLEIMGVGHLPEIADGQAPHRPRGAPFQAWSLGELLRIRKLIQGR